MEELLGCVKAGVAKRKTAETSIVIINRYRMIGHLGVTQLSRFKFYSVGMKIEKHSTKKES